MGYKSRSQVEREGERAFERNPYDRDRNPYREYDGCDERRHHRDWDDGFRSAERRDEERQEEERRAEVREQQRQHEVERQRQQQENEYWANREYEREQEEETYRRTRLHGHHPRRGKA